VIQVDPAEIEDLLCYKLLTGLMVPRPVAFVSTVGADGVFNAAPFSWNTVACIKPPMLAFSPGRTPGRPESKLDTLRNVEATGEFVTNIVTYDIERRMVEASYGFTPEVDEFDAVGLTPVASDVVAAPRIGESLVSFECKVESVTDMGGGDCALVLGRVVRIHLHQSVYRDGRLDLSPVGQTGRMGGTEYVRTDDTFRLGELREPVPEQPVTDYVYE
jgi:flavin reductase (DIM6/NTAB) family NADH-FMN oxidoreductase RutF